MIRLLKDANLKNCYVTSTNYEFSHLVTINKLNLRNAIYLLYQGSLSVELPQYGIKTICGVEPLATESMCIKPESVDQYKAILKESYNADFKLDKNQIQIAKSIVDYDNHLCRGSTSDMLMTELDNIYHFGNVRQTADQISKIFSKFSHYNLVKYDTEDFTTYTLVKNKN